jgi:hypothetical protein
VPAGRDARQVGLLREAILKGLLRKGRMQHALAPHPGLPAALLPGGVEPVAAAWRHIGEAGGLGPRDEPAAGVGLGAVPAGDPLVELHPLVELGNGGIPAHAVEIRVADGNDAAGPGHPPHFPQRLHRIGQVLQDLVGVDHIEGVVLEIKVINVARYKLNVLHAAVGRQLAGVGDHIGGAVQPRHFPGGHQKREVTRDAARPAPDVEHRYAGGEVRDNERGRILRRPRGMGPDHGLVVAVSVDIFRLLRAHRETLLLLRTSGR